MKSRVYNMYCTVYNAHLSVFSFRAQEETWDRLFLIQTSKYSYVIGVWSL